MKKIKISELPDAVGIEGLYTIGTDKENRSVKVSLELLKNEAKGITDAPKDDKKYVRKNGSWTEETQIDTSGFAKKSEIPSIDGLLKETTAKELYQPKGDYITEETDPTVPSWAKSPNKPKYTAEEVGAIPKSTEILSPTDADRKYATIEKLATKADKISQENTSETTSELQPNKYYIFGEVPTLTITLVAGEKNVLAEYMFEFTSGTAPTTLSLPDGVKWIGDSTIEAGMTYQVSIVNNIAVMGGTES